MRRSFTARRLYNCHTPPVIRHRNTACTLAHRTSPSPFANPTTAANPANVNKIQSRAAQVAGHLSASSQSHSTSQSQSRMTSLPISEKGYNSKVPSQYGIRSVGAPHTLEHRTYVEKDGVPLSPFHDIPLYANEQQTVMNMIVEIPRWSNAKQEVRHNLSRAAMIGEHSS